MNYSLSDVRTAEITRFCAGDGAFSYEYFGARRAEQNGEQGVLFRVWAPNARERFGCGRLQRLEQNRAAL